MECHTIALGGIYQIENDSVYKNTESRGHYYLVIGMYGKSTGGMVQCMCITSMFGREVMVEVPIAFRGRVSYITPYNILSFPSRNFDDFSYAGGLISSNITLYEFIELLHDIHKDSIVYSFRNMEFHTKVAKKYNSYMDSFYEAHKDMREFRFDKYHTDGLREPADKTFEKVYYCGEEPIRHGDTNIKIQLVDSNEKLVEFTPNSNSMRKGLPVEPDFNSMSDQDLYTYYSGLLTITASDYSNMYSIPNLDISDKFGKKREKNVLTRMFYNSRHKAKSELMKRGIINNDKAAITI